jgi:hypothetical protein
MVVRSLDITHLSNLLRIPSSHNITEAVSFTTAALHALPAILNRFAPGGVIHGDEWEGRNPRRADRNAGSFKVNIRSGRWADFATGDKGGDAVSLVAYLTGLGQADAARRLCVMLGVKHE